MLESLRDKARALKRETLTLYFAARDPRTPWYAKLYVGFVVAYALSPIDLIPDFIPVLGFIDEVILLPFALALALRLIPASIVASARDRARKHLDEPRPRSYGAAAAIVCIWVLIAGLSAWAFYHA